MNTEFIREHCIRATHHWYLEKLFADSVQVYCQLCTVYREANTRRVKYYKSMEQNWLDRLVSESGNDQKQKSLNEIGTRQLKVTLFDIMKSQSRASTRSTLQNNTVTTVPDKDRNDVELLDCDKYSTLDFHSKAENKQPPRMSKHSRRIRRPIAGSLKCKFCPYTVTKKKRQGWSGMFINYFAHMASHNYVYKCSECELSLPSATQMKAHLVICHNVSNLKNLQSCFNDCLENSCVLLTKKLPFGSSWNECGNYVAEEGEVNEVAKKIMEMYDQGSTLTDASFNVIPMSKIDVAGYNNICEVAGKIECIKCGTRSKNVEDMKLHQQCHSSLVNEQSPDINSTVFNPDGDGEDLEFQNEHPQIIVVVQ